MPFKIWLTGNKSPPAFAGPEPGRIPSGSFPIFTKKPAMPWLPLSWPVILNPRDRLLKPRNGISLRRLASAVPIGKPRLRTPLSASVRKFPLAMKPEFPRKLLQFRSRSRIPCQLFNRKFLPASLPRLNRNFPVRRPPLLTLAPRPPRKTRSVAGVAVAVAATTASPTFKEALLLGARLLPPPILPPPRGVQQRRKLPSHQKHVRKALVQRVLQRQNLFQSTQSEVSAAAPEIRGSHLGFPNSKCSFADS